MSKLAPKLKHRVQIQRPVQVPAANGGFDRTYETLSTVWAAMTELSDYVKYIRGVAEPDQAPTHDFLIRKAAVDSMGKEMSLAFASSFKQMSDLIKLKSDMFIFLQQGSIIKGRRFQIMTIKQDENYSEFIHFRAMEIEEKGTGWPK